MWCWCSKGRSWAKKVASKALRYPRVVPQKAPTPFPQPVIKSTVKK